MFIKRVLVNSILITIIIAVFCYLNEKLGFSLYGFGFSSSEFSDPLVYAAIAIIAIIYTVLSNFQIKNLSKAAWLFFLVIILMMVFDFYFDTKKNEKTGEYEIERKEQIEAEMTVSSDTLHVSLKTIYFIASGGTINATCDNGYRIVIESQDNTSSSSWSRLIYSFSSKSDYMDAIEYINKKGYRWIINHQFENEYSWNAEHRITFEDSGSSMKIVNTMTLSQIKKVW